MFLVLEDEVSRTRVPLEYLATASLATRNSRIKKHETVAPHSSSKVTTELSEPATSESMVVVEVRGQ